MQLLLRALSVWRSDSHGPSDITREMGRRSELPHWPVGGGQTGEEIPIGMPNPNAKPKEEFIPLDIRVKLLKMAIDNKNVIARNFVSWQVAYQAFMDEIRNKPKE